MESIAHLKLRVSTTMMAKVSVYGIEGATGPAAPAKYGQPAFATAFFIQNDLPDFLIADLIERNLL